VSARIWSYTHPDYRAEVERLEDGRFLATFEGPDGAAVATREDRAAAIHWASDRIDEAYAAAHRLPAPVATVPARTMRPGEGTATAYGTRTGD
jgi:hypothetical protein